MDRNKIVNAILEAAEGMERTALKEALRHIVSDASLIMFARSMGIDTDAVLTGVQL